MSEEWRERERPNRLEKRYKFNGYSNLSDFLDRAAKISEKDDLYPDMGFGSDYVNVTIYTAEGIDKLDQQQHDFSTKLDILYKEFPLKS